METKVRFELNLQQRGNPRFLFLCFQLSFNGSKAVLLKLVCLCKSPGDLNKCMFVSVGPGWGLRFCISNKLMTDTAAGLWTTL